MPIPILVKDIAFHDSDLSLRLLKTSLENVPRKLKKLRRHADDINSLVWYISRSISLERVSLRKVLEEVIPLCNQALEFVRVYEKHNNPEVRYAQVMYERLVEMQEYAMGKEAVN